MWDSAAKGSLVALSNSDLDATNSTASWNSVLATMGRTAGKRQFEAIVVATANVFIGICTKQTAGPAVLSNYMDYGSGVRYSHLAYYGVNGLCFYSVNKTGVSYQTSYRTGGATFGATDRITVLVDFDAMEIKFKKNGVLQSSLTGTIYYNDIGDWFPAASLYDGGKVTLVGTGLTYPEAGYTDWAA